MQINYYNGISNSRKITFLNNKNNDTHSKKYKKVMLEKNYTSRCNPVAFITVIQKLKRRIKKQTNKESNKRICPTTPTYISNFNNFDFLTIAAF